ncbi:ribonuclease H-like domain-containing protein [Rhizophagus irregularis DAOM 181602=DAOM 197198]|nr:ribonuclease H-like domain-containing protein [Rhizophagus irregularis DAOM 181602=DAOM 197198]GBC21923.2 ribonuclease H-like domain-containing protein [Rhizophagus irregularis DAOM 181602=DAOM 197198]
MLIKNLMNNAELKQIKINCFVSDSAGEYAAARRQLRVEYPKAALKTLITKCSPERIGTPSTSRAGVSRQLSKFNSSAKNISYTHFGQWLIYYYQAWFNETPKRILRDYLSYQRLAPELSKLALHLFGICVNAASVERLWSNMGFLHSTRRNKLHHKKVLAMAQLRSDILCKRKRDDIEISERQYKRLHIAEPIQEYQSDEEDTNDNEFTFNAFNDSDTEELEETSVIDECQRVSSECDLGSLPFLALLQGQKSSSARKIIRIHEIKYIPIYENDMMKEIYKSAMKDDLGKEFQVKKHDNLIDKNGNFNER